MAVIIREVIPDGSQWGIKGEILRDWSGLEFGQDLKASSSIKFDYPNQGTHFDKLRTGMYIIVEIDGVSTWNDSIFYVTERSGPLTTLIPGNTQFAGHTLRKRLEKVKWMPAFGSSYMDSESFRYTNVTPRDVIKAGVDNYLSRAKSKYGDPSHWISSVHSSQTWGIRVDELLPATTSVHDMLVKYQDLGIAAARFEGFMLRVEPYDWMVGSTTRDKSDSVQLKAGVNLTEATYSESNDNVITALLVKGGADPFREAAEGTEIQTNVVQWVTATPEQIRRYGYHEDVLEVGSAVQPSTLQAIGQNYLRNHMEPKHSTSYTMVDSLYDPRTGALLPTPRALLDFQCGDSIRVLQEDGASIEKVFAITLSYENSTRSEKVGLLLNDYFDSWETTFDQRLKRLGG